MPLENLHGGGLPGAVGAEQGEHLAVRNGKINARDRGTGAVRLAEAGDLDRCHA
jgi:hypothetical protein